MKRKPDASALLTNDNQSSTGIQCLLKAIQDSLTTQTYAQISAKSTT